MKCALCGGDTAVVNSRHKTRSNSVWRRRKCLSCGNIATTTENYDLGTIWVVSKSSGKYEPFNRDKLFLSIHSALMPLINASVLASDLTESVISALKQQSTESKLESLKIRQATLKTLQRYNKLAAERYKNYHV